MGVNLPLPHDFTVMKDVEGLFWVVAHFHGLRWPVDWHGPWAAPSSAHRARARHAELNRLTCNARRGRQAS